MKTYVIKAPEGFEAVETTVDGVTNISFIPKTIEKKLPTTLEDTIPLMSEYCYYIGITGSLTKESGKDSQIYPNTITSEEYAKAFLALMQLIRFRDIWNDGWIADWGENSDEKYAICFDDNKIKCSCYYSTHHVLVFKTSELRDEFLEIFKDLIETAKPIL